MYQLNMQQQVSPLIRTGRVPSKASNRASLPSLCAVGSIHPRIILTDTFLSPFLIFVSFITENIKLMIEYWKLNLNITT